jgi:ABC-2 type transport system permease protein
VVGRFVLPGRGFTVEHGYLVRSLTDGPVLRAAVGSVVYLVLAAHRLGVATAVRDTVTAIAVVLAKDARRCPPNGVPAISEQPQPPRCE